MRSMDMKKNREIILFVLLFLIVISTSFFAKNADFYYTQGVIAFNAGDYSTAEKYLKTALMLNPALENNSDIKYMIGLSAWYAGDTVTARAYLPNDHISMLSSSTKISRRNLVADIAKWESLSSPIINVEGNQKKNKVSKALEWTIFLSIFLAIMGGFFGYKFIKKRKKLRAFRNENEEEVEDISQFEMTQNVATPVNMNGEFETPSDAPSEDDIKSKLQNLLSEDFSDSTKESKNEKEQVMEDPEKIIEKVGSDANEEEIEQLEGAIQEVLSKESEKSEKVAT